MSTRAQLITLLDQKILTGGRRTTALFVRQLMADVISSTYNITDDGPLVPYNGANANVDLGTKTLNAGAAGFSYAQVYAPTSGASFFCQAADPIQHSQYMLMNDDSTIRAEFQLKNTNYGTNGVFIAGGAYLETDGPRLGILNYGSGDIVFATGVYSPNVSPTIKASISSSGLFTINGDFQHAGTMLGLYNKTPIAQPTVSNTSAAAITPGGGTGLTDTDTIGNTGWTWAKFAQAVFNTNILND